MTDVAPKNLESSRPDGMMAGITAPKTRSRNPRLPGSTGRKRNLEKDLTTTLKGIGQAVALVNPVDGAIIINGAEPLAKALNDIAKDNDRLYRWLVAAQTGSKYGALFVAVAGIVTPILINHNVIDLGPMKDKFMPDLTAVFGDNDISPFVEVAPGA